MTIRHLLNGDETKETKSVVRFVWLKATDILLTSVYISQKKKKKKKWIQQTVYTCSLIKLLSHVGYYRMLSQVCCAVQ